MIQTHNCHQRATCVNKRGSYSCGCNSGFVGDGFECRYSLPKSCSGIKGKGSSSSNVYVIDPDGEGGLALFSAFCDMRDKNGVGVTFISHDSEKRTRVQGCEPRGCYSRVIHYTGASLSQLASLTTV